MGKIIRIGNTEINREKITWAYSETNEGHLLGSYEDDNGNIIGIPFSFIRNSPAYEERNGLLYEVGIDVPRFKDGKLFTEGTKENLLINNEAFSAWTNYQITKSLDSTVKNPINNDYIKLEHTGNSIPYPNINKKTFALSGDYNLSVYGKLGNSEAIFISIEDYNGAKLRVLYNSSTKSSQVVIETGGATVLAHGFVIEGGSIRLWANVNLPTETYDEVSCGICKVDISPISAASGTYAYFFGIALTEGIGLSSLILTPNGTTVTRQAGTGIKSMIDLSNEINSKEFVISTRFSTPALPAGLFGFNINASDTNSDMITLSFVNSASSGYAQMVVSGVSGPAAPFSITGLEFIKIDVFVVEDTLQLWVNEIFISKKYMPNSESFGVGKLNKISFNRIGTGDPFKGIIDYFTVYPSLAEAQKELTYLTI